jgi:SulP family sulfate permease
MASWLRSYRRDWLLPDVIAGLVIWSVVTPQAVAYAQIAGLPPDAGLAAAPGAMLAYALLGTSRTLVVSATTATSALSAATVGPLAGGDTARFLALSATLALVTGVVLVLGGLLRFGAISDLVSRPVMTGFLFGLGLTIIVGQLPSLIGVPAGHGDFFTRGKDLIEDLGEAHGATIAVGLACVVLLAAGKRLVPRLPTMLIVLVASIVASAVLDLDEHGVATVGDLPAIWPSIAVPDVDAGDITNVLGAALGILLLSTEAVGVSRGIATKDGYDVDTNRDLVAMGGSNLVAGLMHGFVQSGGASQTMAAENAGGRSQLGSIVAAGLIVLTAGLLTSLFEPLPQATLAAIVIVAVASFLDVTELRRIAAIRRSAIAFAAVALGGVLVLGVLQGLVVAAGLSLVYVIKRLARPSVGALGRNPDTGVWERLDRHEALLGTEDGVLVVRSDGVLLYANAVSVRDRITELAEHTLPAPRIVVLDLSALDDIDVESLDVLDELRVALERLGAELVLAGLRVGVAELLRRHGLAERVRAAPTVDAALSSARVRNPHPDPA